MVSGAGFRIPAFDNSSTTIDKWVERLENFMMAEYGTIQSNRKKAVLLTAIGDEALIAIENFSTEEKSTYETLKEKILDYFKEKKNDIVERHRFHTLKQDDDENFEDYLNRLMAQAAKCNFRILCKPETPPTTVGGNDGAAAEYHDVTNEFLRDRIVVGLRDSSTRRRIMREKNLSLEQVVDLIKAAEIANLQLKKLCQGKEGLSVNANSKTFKGKGPRSSSVEETKTIKCKFCGTVHVRGASYCPAFGKSCSVCNKKNHSEKVCYKKRRQEVNANEQYDQSSDSEDYQLDIGMIDCDPDEILDVDMHMLDWFEQVSLNGTIHTVKVDTGAQANVISEAELAKLQTDRTIRETKVILSAYGGSKIPVVGKVDIEVKKLPHGDGLRGETAYATAEFIVVKPNVKTILGLPLCVALEYVKPNTGGAIKSYCVNESPRVVVNSKVNDQNVNNQLRIENESESGCVVSPEPGGYVSPGPVRNASPGPGGYVSPGPVGNVRVQKYWLT